MARPKRFELLTPRFVVWCSIQLSYGRVLRGSRKEMLRPTGSGTRPSYRLRPALARLASGGAARRRRERKRRAGRAPRCAKRWLSAHRRRGFNWRGHPELDAAKPSVTSKARKDLVQRQGDCVACITGTILKSARCVRLIKATIRLQNRRFALEHNGNKYGYKELLGATIRSMRWGRGGKACFAPASGSGSHLAQRARDR